MGKKKRFFIILLVLALLVGGVSVWQRNNIRALRMSQNMSQQELSDKITEQQDKTVGLSRDAGVQVRPLTDEEREAMRKDEISREELIESLIGTQETPVPQAPADGETAPPPQTGEQPQPSAPTQTETDSNAALREQLAKYVAEIYVMEAEYSGWLEKANQAAIDEFNALPEAQQTATAKFNIGMRYLKMASEKEKECDAKMSELEGKIRAILKQLDEPTTLVDEIHSTYLEEKAAKKAYYLGLH